MTRKHFQAIADVFAGEIAVTASPEGKLALANAAISLGHVLRQENPRFDRQRFYRASGVFTVRPELEEN